MALFRARFRARNGGRARHGTEPGATEGPPQASPVCSRMMESMPVTGRMVCAALVDRAPNALEHGPGRENP